MSTLLEITPDDPMSNMDSIKSPQIHRCGFCAFTTRHLPALHSHVASQHKDQELQKPLACKVGLIFSFDILLNFPFS